MKGMIFAAGLGTRLRPLTDAMPKALVPVAGVPALGRVIGKLRDAGVEEVIVNAHHFKERIEDYIARTDFGVSVRVSAEDGGEPLETGGGIKHAEPLLRGGSGRFLVHNVDIVSNLDLKYFLERDAEGDSLATLLVTRRPSDRYLLFDEQMHLCGWTNVRTGEVKSPYKNFDPARSRRFSFCGVHCISERVFDLMSGFPDKFGIVDFYLCACAENKIRGIEVPDLEFIDIGTPESLKAAQEWFCGKTAR